jgi:CRP-like cAMP-binding protein
MDRIMRSAKVFQASAGDMAALLAVLNYFHPLSDETIAYLDARVSKEVYAKDEMIVEAGRMCDHIYFILRGATRGFIREGKKEITTWITVENEMVTSIYSLDINAPAIENIQAIEDCEMLVLDYKTVDELYERFPEFNIVIRKLLQVYYRDAEGRAFIARLTKAENKYQHFLERSPHLANRVPLKYIASYLGMTIETLSRVRRKIWSGSRK